MIFASSRFKSWLTRVGAVTPEVAFHYLDAVLNYMGTGHWLKKKGYDTSRRVPTRFQVFDAAAAQAGEEKVLYLEFGVAQGGSMRYWSKLLQNPDAHLHGFDSFEGLPTHWTSGHPQGYFSTGGKPPEIDDPRVEFFKGWFNETLPSYTPPAHERLIVNLDADLYSSTAFVLTHLRELIEPGTLVYFDEFNHRADELRAFDEFVSETGFRFRLVAATDDLVHVLFERL